MKLLLSVLGSASETHFITLGVTCLITLFLVRHYRYSSQHVQRRHLLHSTIPDVKRISATTEPLVLPELYRSAKAMLVLRRGADAWLPYMIPLYAEITKFGNDLLAQSVEGQMAFELLHSLSIDEEHCIIQAYGDQFVIFDRARFNNTLVDDNSVPPEGLLLVTGARITLGLIEYIFITNRANAQ